MEKRVPLLFPFFLALIATGYASVFLKEARLHTFVPFLALLYARCSRMSCLWISSLCGLILDLLASQLRFGTHALSFALVTLLLYAQKKQFDHEKPLAFSLFTFQLSLCVTLALFLFSLFSHISFALNIKWIGVDFVLMAFFDALYAFLWFYCPMMCYARLRRLPSLNVLQSLKKRAKTD